ncbi:hypothetical protein BD410DRAFT_377237 [Rickenella mellea]|uniref:RING-type domain-containing protein n=1 Tax=Rickenella mellea TaxID=50990 RepID=A0A4Y7PZ43_9AGAM|nr:hypothetical protein BD410DRAFT_377237 [Rickenella mellea]
MLVINANSTCDVCLETYSANGPTIPHAITCGHTFCLRCLQSLEHRRCPLCREPFQPFDVRKLHFDASAAPSSRPVSASNPSLHSTHGADMGSTSEHALLLQQRITEIVRESSVPSGVSQHNVQDLLEDVHRFLSSEPADRHADLRAAFLLLYRFTETLSKCLQLERSITDIRAQKAQYEQTTLEVEKKCQELQKKNQDEKSNWRAIETCLREQMDKIDSDWHKKYTSVLDDNMKLRTEVVRFQDADYSRLAFPSTELVLRKEPMDVSRDILPMGGSEADAILDAHALQMQAPEEGDSLLHISPVSMSIVLPSRADFEMSDSRSAGHTGDASNVNAYTPSSSPPKGRSTASEYFASRGESSGSRVSPHRTGNDRSETQPAPPSQDYFSNSHSRKGLLHHALTSHPHTPGSHHSHSDANSEEQPAAERLYDLLDTPSSKMSSSPVASSPLAQRRDSQPSQRRDSHSRPSVSGSRPIVKAPTMPMTSQSSGSDSHDRHAESNRPSTSLPATSQSQSQSTSRVSLASQACSHLVQKSGPLPPALTSHQVAGASQNAPRRGSTSTASTGSLRDATNVHPPRFHPQQMSHKPSQVLAGGATWSSSAESD